MLYVGSTCKSAFERFQEHIREAKRLSKALLIFFVNWMFAKVLTLGNPSKMANSHKFAQL